MKKKLTLKKMYKIFQTMESSHQPNVIYTSPKVYEKIQEILNAPWYIKIWYRITTPWYKLLDWIENKRIGY